MNNNIEIQMVKGFTFLWKIYEYRNKKGKFPLNVINMIGSRKSGKTFSIALFIGISLITRPTAAYICRFLSKNLQETIDNTLQVIDSLNIKYKYNKTRQRLVFQNGSFIKFKSLHQTNDKTGTMTGLADTPITHDKIIWVEEAFEFKDNDFTMLESAIRGGNDNQLYIKSCNPWLITNKYIEYCNSHLQFNKKILGSLGEQYLIKTINFGKDLNGDEKISKEIFHYSNWKINNFLKEADKLNLEKIKTQTPYLADASYYGVPGSMGGLIFNEIMYRIKDPDFICDEFVGGIDYGIAESNTTAGLWGRSSNNLKLVKIDEWYNDNSIRSMEPTDMGISICNFYRDLAIEIPQLKRNGLTVYVDYSATGFISILKEKAKYLGLSDWLSFEKCFKPEVLYAINCFYTAISNQCIYMVKNNVENTIKEYSTMAWDVKENTDNVKPIKKWDHTFDSDKYALFSSGWIYDLELID